MMLRIFIPDMCLKVLFSVCALDYDIWIWKAENILFLEMDKVYFLFFLYILWFSFHIFDFQSEINYVIFFFYLLFIEFWNVYYEWFSHFLCVMFKGISVSPFLFVLLTHYQCYNFYVWTGFKLSSHYKVFRLPQNINDE